MVAAPLAPNFRGGDLKISDQNNWGGGEDLSKLNLEGAKFKGGPIILGGRGVYEPQ